MMKNKNSSINLRCFKNKKSLSKMIIYLTSRCGHVCKSVRQPRETCHNEFRLRDPATVLPRHCICLTRSFTSYDFTNHIHNLRGNHVLHALNANGINSRPEPPPGVSFLVSRHPHGCRREGSAACTSVERPKEGRPRPSS